MLSALAISSRFSPTETEILSDVFRSVFTSLLSLSLPAWAAEDSTQPPDVFQNLKFRNLGPAAGGGRVAAVARKAAELLQ